jgi:hypothetical protein
MSSNTPFGSTLFLQDPVVWFDENWMFVGLVASCGLLMTTFRHLPPSSMALWGYLSVWMYSLHQFEEHGAKVSLVALSRKKSKTLTI